MEFIENKTIHLDDNEMKYLDQVIKMTLNCAVNGCFNFIKDNYDITPKSDNNEYQDELFDYINKELKDSGIYLVDNNKKE